MAKSTIIETKQDIVFVGCGINDDFIMDKIRQVKDGNVIIIQPLALNENLHGKPFNIYEAKQSKVAALTKMYEACKLLVKSFDKELEIVIQTKVIPALSKAEGKE